MTVTLIILLAIAIVYCVAVSALYGKKNRQAAQFYENWRSSASHAVELASTVADLRDNIADLSRTDEAKQREIDTLKTKIAEAEAKRQQWKERARNFKQTGERHGSTTADNSLNTKTEKGARKAPKKTTTTKK